MMGGFTEDSIDYIRRSLARLFSGIVKNNHSQKYNEYGLIEKAFNIVCLMKLYHQTRRKPATGLMLICVTCHLSLT